MLKKILSTLIGTSLVLQCLAQSQTNPAIISLFEHQTETPVAYPNYFQDKSFTDPLIQIIQSWLEENYGATSLDYKKIYPVSFVSVISPPIAPRNIEGTGYSFALGIQTTLESGLTMDKYKKEEGVLRFNIWLMDRKGRKIFKNKIASKFIIALKPNNPSTVYISKKDFQKLYLEGLQAALNIKPVPRPQSFQQPDDESLTKLVQQSEAQVFNRVDRGTFEIKSKSEHLKNTLTFEVPFQKIDVFSRAAQFYNAVNQKTYQMESSLKNSQPGRINTEIQDDRKILARFQTYVTQEELLIEANLDNDIWELKRNLFSDQISVYKYKKLQALLLFKGGEPNYKAQYTLHLKPDISTLDQVTIINLLGAEALIQAVRKFHKVETRK